MEVIIIGVYDHPTGNIREGIDRLQSWFTEGPGNQNIKSPSSSWCVVDKSLAPEEELCRIDAPAKPRSLKESINS
jgi:hypothetical protein